jgi:ATP/ADP translocase
MVTRQKGVTLAGARAAESEEAEFQFRDILSAMAHHRHLQVITGIIILTFIVDVTIEYQFNAMAKLAYQSKTQLTAFGQLLRPVAEPGHVLPAILLTAAVMRWFGVGGTCRSCPLQLA